MDIQRNTTLCTWQIKTQVGIMNGIIQNLVNLLYIEKDNIMIGIVIVGINLIQEGPTKGKIRKLSVTVSLTDPKEYKVVN